MSDVTPSIDWDSMSDSPYIKWDAPGDTVTGMITAVSVGQDFNGNPCPVINLTTPDGEERILSCGQANLKSQIVTEKPAPGSTITVTYTHDEKAAKGMKKMFAVEVIPF